MPEEQPTGGSFTAPRRFRACEVSCEKPRRRVSWQSGVVSCSGCHVVGEDVGGWRRLRPAPAGAEEPAHGHRQQVVPTRPHIGSSPARAGTCTSVAERQLKPRQACRADTTLKGPPGRVGEPVACLWPNAATLRYGPGAPMISSMPCLRRARDLCQFPALDAIESVRAAQDPPATILAYGWQPTSSMRWFSP